MYIYVHVHAYHTCLCVCTHVHMQCSVACGDIEKYEVRKQSSSIRGATFTGSTGGGGVPESLESP